MSGLFVIGFLFLLITGVPVVQSIGIGSLLGQMETTGVAVTTFATSVIGGLNKSTIASLPLFLIAGALMNGGGVTKRLFKFANYLVGWLPGGLAHVNIVASLIFAGMSGSAIADLGGLGTIEIKAMRDKGFPEEIIVAVTGCSALLGPMIPPSVVFIMYGVWTSQSIGALFMAGFLPGIVMALGMMVLVTVLDFKYHFPRQKRPSAKEMLFAFLDSIPAMMTVVIILLGMYTGIFTTTEAASIAVLWALFLSTVVYKEIKVKDFVDMIGNVMDTMGSMTMIIGFAAVFGTVLIRSLLPQTITAAVTSAITSDALMLLVIVVILLICGCFLETTSGMAILLPILIPILEAQNFSLIQFGIVFTLAFGVGGMTPPFGVLIFMMQKITGNTTEMVVKSFVPWIILMIICLLLITFIPEISLTLPRLAGYIK